MNSNKPRILFYDIETSPLLAYVWRLGEQVVRFDQLVEGRDMYDIICIGYCWNDGKPAQALDWGFKKQDSRKMLEKFDEIIKEADVVIGKNSDRFDNKHINVHRFLNDQDGMPEWVRKAEDLEKFIRKNFAFPSYGLDYISKLLKLGGKNKMGLGDWIDIVEKRDPAALEKMITYCKKDVEDTRAIWDRASKHFIPKFNVSTSRHDFCCTHCGSKNLKQNGTSMSGKTIYQNFFCKDHGGYAGRRPIKVSNEEVVTKDRLGR